MQNPKESYIFCLFVGCGGGQKKHAMCMIKWISQNCTSLSIAMCLFLVLVLAFVWPENEWVNLVCKKSKVEHWVKMRLSDFNIGFCNILAIKNIFCQHIFLEIRAFRAPITKEVCWKCCEPQCWYHSNIVKKP